MVSITAENVWVKFNVQFIRQEMSLRRYLVQMFHSGPRASAKHTGNTIFWALRGISLNVTEGEIVGLLGRNGAGKSTLLMTLAGIYAPDRGQVTIHGKIGTLLTLGGGFNPELTGIENIRQSGVFLGLSPEYLEAKMDEIIEMADLGDFINAPLKTYSSGMYARLGFSIAVHINPDVILLDEVLEAGDQAFRLRSRNLLETFHEQGKTIVIATHSPDVLRQFCTRVILLDHGEILADGPPEEILAIYDEQSCNKEAVAQPLQSKIISAE